MIYIRNLQKKDAPEVALLIAQLTQNIVEPRQLIRRIGDLPLQKNSVFLVAIINNEIIGFAGLAWYIIPSKGLIGWIEEVVVDEKCRGQGIAGKLMKNLLLQAKKKKIRVLKLTVSNPVAKELYESLGFTKKDSEYLFKNLF